MHTFYGVRANGNDEKILSIGLKEILDCVEDGPEYKWAILWFKGFGKIDGESILDFEKKVNESDHGFPVTWEEINHIANEIWQIIDLVLIGNRSAEGLKKFEDDNAMYSSSDFTIELVDSGYWIIHSTSEANVLPFKRLEGSTSIDN